MEIEGTYTFQAPIEHVWKALMDPEVLARCLPGVESMQETGPDTYAVKANVGIGAVKGSYSGKVTITDKQEPTHYRLIGEFSSARGFVKGEGTIDLTRQNGNTVATYKGTPQLGGAIAGVAMRMLSGIGKTMANQFFGNIAQELRTQTEQAAAPAAATATPVTTAAASTPQATTAAASRSQPVATTQSITPPHVVVRPTVQQPDFMIQLVRLLKVSNGSPEDEQRWAQRLMLGGAGIVLAIAMVGFLLGRLTRRTR